MSADVILRTLNLGKRYKPLGCGGCQPGNSPGRCVWLPRTERRRLKFTSIHMILSLIQPTTGSVELFSHQLQTDRENALAKVAGIVREYAISIST